MKIIFNTIINTVFFLFGLVCLISFITGLIGIRYEILDTITDFPNQLGLSMRQFIIGG